MSVETGFGATGRRPRREARSLPSTSGRRMATPLAGSERGEIQMFSIFTCSDTETLGLPGGGAADDQEEMLELEHSSEEAISSVSGYSVDSLGFTHSLSASTTAGRSWGPHGGYNSLRNSPGGNLRLRFLSGDQTGGNLILR